MPTLSMKKIGIPVAVLMGILMILALFLPHQANALSAQEQVCAGLGAVDGGSGCADPAGESSLGDTVKNVINILSLVVGMVAIIMVIVGGLKYVTSQGDSSGVASAKNTIIYAVVGIIIVTLAQVMVRFVIGTTVKEPVSSSVPGPTGGQLPTVNRN